MKKTFLYALLTAVVASSNIDMVATAQSYYPKGGTKTFRINDSVTYVCRDKLLMELYNIENTLVDVRQRFKNGDPTPYTKTRPYTERVSNFAVFHNFIQTVFSAEEKRKAADDVLIVSIYFDSDTGNVREVRFSFNLNDHGFSEIPPESYYRLELKIREKIKVEITDAGRELNYNMMTIPYKGVFFGQPPLTP